MTLKLNREYVMRHLFAAAVLAGLGGWFAWDGFVTYPATPAADLYVAIERSEPPEDYDLVHFKDQKVASQRSFAAVALLAALVVGLRLGVAARFRFEFDDTGFSVGGRRYAYSDIREVDRVRWEKKGIVLLKLPDRSVQLDSWHHLGVDQFLAKLPQN